MFSPKKVMEFFSPFKTDAGEKREGRAFADFYVLFSLDGHEDKVESGAKPAILICGPGPTMKVVFTDTTDDKKESIAIDLKDLAAISILSRFHTTTDSSELLGVAHRTPEAVLHFYSEITMVSNALWLWAPDVINRNLLVEYLDDLYESPGSISQVKLQDIVQVHNVAISTLPRSKEFKKNALTKLKRKDSRMFCRLCKTMIPVQELDQHAALCSSIDVKCQVCGTLVRENKLERHSLLCFEEDSILNNIREEPLKAKEEPKSKEPKPWVWV